MKIAIEEVKFLNAPNVFMINKSEPHRKTQWLHYLTTMPPANVYWVSTIGMAWMIDSKDEAETMFKSVEKILKAKGEL